jgi:ATP-dependent DNA ligase
MNVPPAILQLRRNHRSTDVGKPTKLVDDLVVAEVMENGQGENLHVLIHHYNETCIQHFGPLPLPSPILLILAKRVDEIPLNAEGWSFEPKWDGLRTVIFRNGEELLIQSRDGKPLDRYFPELRAPLLHQLPARCVLDGEIVIAR